MARYRQGFAVGVALAGLVIAAPVSAQQLVVGASGDPAISGLGPLLVIRDLAAQWDDLAPVYVHPTNDGALNAHGLAMGDRDHVLAARAASNRIDWVDLTQNTIDFPLFPAGSSDQISYQGYGTIALNPARTHVLIAAGSPPPQDAHRNKVWVMSYPPSPGATAAHVLLLPGALGTAQTRAVAFDAGTGRAYIAHSGGVSAVDPPYQNANLVFTISLPPVVPDAAAALGRSVALSPDGQTLISTAAAGSVHVVHAPFQATSVVDVVNIPNAQRLQSAAFTPDGAQAIVVDNDLSLDLFSAQCFALPIPYSAAAPIERLSLPRGATNNGFEDLAISADGQFLALVGGSLAGDRLILVRAPFTASAFRVQALPISWVGLPYGPTGRGTGHAAFWSTAGAVSAQLTIERSSVIEGGPGLRRAELLVNLSHAVAQPVSVNYNTTNGSALAGIDYQASSGVLQFAPGTRQQRVGIDVIGNTQTDGNRSFRVVLSSPQMANVVQNLSGPDGEIQIVDDDGAQPVILGTSPLPEACLGMPYSVPFSAQGLTGDTSWSIGNQVGVLNGLTLNAQTGVLSGTPTAVDQGSFNVVVRGDFPQIANRDFALRVRMSCDALFASGFE